MNLAQELSPAFQRHPEKPAILFEGRSWRFRQVDEEIRKRSLWLAGAGVGRGDRVALFLPKGMEFIFFHLAVLSVGAVSLPLNPACTGEEVSYSLSDSGSSLLITDLAGLKKLPPFSGAPKILLLDGDSPDGWGPLPRELEKAGAGDCRSYAAGGDEVAMILYTSGTTGKPKGAMITHRNLVSNLVSLKRAWAWTERDVLLHVLPLFHLHGLVVALHGALHAGSTVVMHEKFDPRRAWRTLEKEGCTLLMAVPTIYHRMLKEWPSVRPDLSALRLFISGSAPLPDNTFRAFEETTGFRILERYGMTETGIITSNPLSPSGRRAQSVGHPLPGVEVRVAGEAGEEVPPGEVGEVWIRGDNVFAGYWRLPEKTRGSFQGRWFKTGDLGYQDPRDRGRLFLVGRAKDLIITGGYNVYPKEVERVLERHEAVQEACVIGLPDEDFGERVAAVVVLKKGRAAPLPKEIIQFCKGHLVGYKCPKEISLVDQLPRNAMGKIVKSLLAPKTPAPREADAKGGLQPACPPPFSN